MVQKSLAIKDHWCGECTIYFDRIEKDPIRCNGCHAVDYCSEECRIGHWSWHKTNCLEARKRYIELDHEEQDLRIPPDGRFAANQAWEDPFETSRGRRFVVAERDTYVQASTDYLDSLLRINSSLSVEKALTRCLDLLSIGAVDSTDIPYFVPFLQLRLHKQQECWDYILWAADNVSSQWGQEEPWEPPALQSDMLGSIESLCKDNTGNGILLAAILLKLTLFLEVKQNLASSAVFKRCQALPPEICDLVEEKLLQSSLGNSWCPESRWECTQVSTVLWGQINTLYEYLDTRDRKFWAALLKLLQRETGPVRAATKSFCLVNGYFQCALKAWEDYESATTMLESLWHRHESDRHWKVALGEIRGEIISIADWDTHDESEIQNLFEGWS